MPPPVQQRISHRLHRRFAAQATGAITIMIAMSWMAFLKLVFEHLNDGVEGTTGLLLNAVVITVLGVLVTTLLEGGDD